jgi:hypothetical protein
MWVRCSAKGDIYIIYPRKNAGNPHASYHKDGTYHNKSYDVAHFPKKRQPLTADFKGSEHLGMFMGHGKSARADCNPTVFDGVVVVEPKTLGPIHGSVGFDIVEPGYEAIWSRDIAGQFYFGDVVQREIFSRGTRPSVVITIQR